jgi:Fe-S oxidoreductase
VLSPLAPLANRAMRTPPARGFFRLLGIDPDRNMPAYKHETFMRWWKHQAREGGRTLKAGTAVRTEGPETPRVALFVDCFMNHNLPEVGKAAVRVLERAGIAVTVAHDACCGRPAMFASNRHVCLLFETIIGDCLKDHSMRMTHASRSLNNAPTTSRSIW